MDDFRFEKLDIWKESIEISDVLFDYADKADDKRKYKFAEQLFFLFSSEEELLLNQRE